MKFYHILFVASVAMLAMVFSLALSMPSTKQVEQAIKHSKMFQE